MRTWPGLAALGAGLIHLGIAAGAPPLQLVAFAVAGAAEAAWGVAALARVVPPRPAAALAGAALLITAQVAVLLTGAHDHDGSGAAAPSGGVPIGAMLGAVALDLALAVLLALRLRRGSAAAREEPGVVGFLLGTAVGAGAVAVVTTSSLAATAVGGQHLH